VALLAAQLLAENRLGYFSFGAVSPLNGKLLFDALLIGAWCLSVGFTEEILFRGYALVEGSRAFSFWPAVVLLSILFGIPHWLKGGGENFFGGMEAFLFGIGLAYSFRITGSLWLAIGFHAGWDYAQSFLFGVPDSGLVSAGRLFHPTIHGPAWLSGGSVGPEGSVLSVAVIVVFVAMVRLADLRLKAEEKKKAAQQAKPGA